MNYSALSRNFLRTLKFLIKLAGAKACSTLKCVPIDYGVFMLFNPLVEVVASVPDIIHMNSYTIHFVGL